MLRVHDVAEVGQAITVAERDPRVGSSSETMDEHRTDNGIESSVEVELRGLSIYTHHGVSDAEQEVGQRLEFDISFDVPDCDAVLTDRLEDTVDYAEVCDIVALAATERSYRTLERLAQVVGERLMERYGCESVRVRAAKPEPPLPLAIQEVAVEVTQERAADEDEENDERARASGRCATGYLGLGSNVGDRAGHLRAAIELLRERGVEVEAVSSAYETEPVGEVLDQPDFLNAAIRIRTELEPEALLDLCKADRGRARPRPRRPPPQPPPARRRPAPARRPRARDRAPDPAAPRGDQPPLRPRPAAGARPRADPARRHAPRRRPRRPRPGQRVERWPSERRRRTDASERECRSAARAGAAAARSGCSQAGGRIGGVLPG